MQKATFAAGCFKSVEASFLSIAGVVETDLGYGGGRVDNPTCDDVAKGKTGHAQLVQVTFDPRKVTYDTLLDVFWECHDPTQLNRQGPNYGSQFRSTIFVHDADQAYSAQTARHAEQASGSYTRPIVTEIELLHAFWPVKSDDDESYPAEKPDMVS